MVNIWALDFTIPSVLCLSQWKGLLPPFRDRFKSQKNDLSHTLTLLGFFSCEHSLLHNQIVTLSANPNCSKVK